jgi:acid phosphatase type 7
MFRFAVYFATISVTFGAPALPKKPTQVHIALAGTDSDGNSNSMAVSWQTQVDTTSSQVNYGLSPGQYTLTSVGQSKSCMHLFILVESFLISYSDYETFHHHVVLADLLPDTVYYYVVGSAGDGFSKEYNFKSAPLSSSLISNFTFAVFGDLGDAIPS